MYDSTCFLAILRAFYDFQAAMCFIMHFILYLCLYIVHNVVNHGELCTVLEMGKYGIKQIKKLQFCLGFSALSDVFKSVLMPSINSENWHAMNLFS